MKTIATIQNDTHNLFLRIQRIDCYINRPLFTTIYEEVSEEEQEKALRLIEELKHEDLIRWTKLNNRTSYEYYNITELRIYASLINIKNINAKSKDELLSDIYQYKRNHEADHSGLA